MMLLACLFCHKEMKSAQYYHDVPPHTLIGFVCPNCGWYAEFDNTKIIDRDGTYGFKDT